MVSPLRTRSPVLRFAFRNSSSPRSGTLSARLSGRGVAAFCTPWAALNSSMRLQTSTRPLGLRRTSSSGAASARDANRTSGRTKSFMGFSSRSLLLREGLEDAAPEVVLGEGRVGVDVLVPDRGVHHHDLRGRVDVDGLPAHAEGRKNWLPACAGTTIIQDPGLVAVAVVERGEPHP